MQVEVTQLSESEWARVIDDEDLQGVAASLHQGVGSTNWWSVSVSAMELCRTDPLEGELCDAITTSLAAVAGVSTAFQEDREVWTIEGDPTGPALVMAVASTVDHFLPRIEQELDNL